MDIEQRPVAEKHFLNTTIHKISWSGLTVAVNDRRTGQPKNIVDNVEGYVNSGMLRTNIHLHARTEPF